MRGARPRPRRRARSRPRIPAPHLRLERRHALAQRAGSKIVREQLHLLADRGQALGRRLAGAAVATASRYQPPAQSSRRSVGKHVADDGSAATFIERGAMPATSRHALELCPLRRRSGAGASTASTGRGLRGGHLAGCKRWSRTVSALRDRRVHGVLSGAASRNRARQLTLDRRRLRRSEPYRRAADSTSSTTASAEGWRMRSTRRGGSNESQTRGRAPLLDGANLRAVDQAEPGRNERGGRRPRAIEDAGQRRDGA